MTSAGARGETASQMAKALHFTLPQERLHPAAAELIRRMTVPPVTGGKATYQLLVANALWGQKGYGFLPEFLNLAKTHYGAGLNEADFVGAPEEARQKINAWVEDKTNKKIQDLITPGVLNELTRLVLVNAVYFKGDWVSKFDKARTRDEPFVLITGQNVNAPMMSQTGKFGYAEVEDAQLLEMPYVGGVLSMVIVLPKKADGLPTLEQQLTSETLAEWLGKVHKTEVRVAVPRFKMTCQFSLNQALMALGMVDAFTPDRADFSGMNGRRDLYISAALHKAFVDVNEEGTEAAAATGVVVGITSAPMEPIIFRADHPFLFAIRDTRTGAMLFVGRVMNPKQG
jgi:serpin B